MVTMSMYNLVHGFNPMAGPLLAALGLAPSDIPRFRDAWWDGTFIAIHTRTGGGNRSYYESLASCQEHYPERFLSGEDDVPAGPWNEDLRQLDGYDHDADDPHDPTYATFYFRPHAALADVIKTYQSTDATPAQRWQAFADKLKAGVDDEQVKRVAAAMQPMIDKISAMMDE